jgi:hypothetical protein
MGKEMKKEKEICEDLKKGIKTLLVKDYTLTKYSKHTMTPK